MSARRVARAGARRRFARRDAGFTLLEVVVAVLVLAVLVGLVPRSLVAARGNLDDSKDRLAARLVAETVLSEALAGPALAPGIIGGEVDGRRWTARLTKVDAPAAENGHFLLDVRVEVAVSGGGTLAVDTMRIGGAGR